jgi:hypothetical protein
VNTLDARRSATRRMGGYTEIMAEPEQLVAMLAAAYRQTHEVPTIRMPALRLLLREYMDISRHAGTSRKFSERRSELQMFLERLYKLRKTSVHARKSWQLGVLHWLSTQQAFLDFASRANRHL